MALTPNFSTSQTYGESSKLTINDISTGSDGAIASRRVYLPDNKGVDLVESGTTTSYEVWPYSDASITFDLLLKDYALGLLVQWLDSGGNVLYQKQILTLFPLYAKTFYINLIKSQSANTKLTNNANFYPNLIKLLCSIKEAEDSVLLADDIASAQAALTRAKQLIDHPEYFY